jgi:membrane protease YdiL (CAAX protease family)
MIQTKRLFKDFISFVKRPESYNFYTIPSREKFRNTSTHFLLIAIIVGVILALITMYIETLKLFRPLVYKYNFGFLVTLFVGTIVAPVFEEGIFRAGLSQKSSNWSYYFSSVVFGLIHIFNFEWDNSMIPYIIIIVSPQIFLGLLFGYIRINYGFWYAVLIHGLYNFILINFAHFIESF